MKKDVAVTFNYQKLLDGNEELQPLLEGIIIVDDALKRRVPKTTPAEWKTFKNTSAGSFERVSYSLKVQ